MKYRDYMRHALAAHDDPAAVEADVLAIRSEMVDTLTRLEDRLSPRKLIELVLQRGRSAGEGSSHFIGNLGGVVRDNPVSTIMLLGGAAAMLNAERRGPRPRNGNGHRRAEEPHGPTLSERTEGVRHDLGERAHDLSERAHGFGERASERAHEAGRRARDARERAQIKGAELQGRARERLHAAREQGMRSLGDARARGQRLLDEEPLLFAGIGLLCGVLAGVSVRLSERERRVIETDRRRELYADPLKQINEPGPLSATERELDAAVEREAILGFETEEQAVVTEVGVAIPPDPNPGPPTSGGGRGGSSGS